MPEPARQHQPQLVLGGDGGGWNAGLRHGGQDGAAAQSGEASVIMRSSPVARSR